MLGAGSVTGGALPSGANERSGDVVFLLRISAISAG